MVTVRIWQDAASYYGELTRFFGTRHQATGYITGPTELRLLAGGNLNTNVVGALLPFGPMVLDRRMKRYADEFRPRA